MNVTIYVSAKDVADHCSTEAEFAADIINNVRGSRIAPGARWMLDFMDALSDHGEAVLRTMVARIDAIDATSTEGR